MHNYESTYKRLPAASQIGLSNTIMIVETTQRVPWTKPEDVECNSKQPLPKLGGSDPQGFHVAFGDGSVVFIENNTPETKLRALFSKQAGEPVSIRE